MGLIFYFGTYEYWNLWEFTVYFTDSSAGKAQNYQYFVFVR